MSEPPIDPNWLLAGSRASEPSAVPRGALPPRPLAQRQSARASTTRKPASSSSKSTPQTQPSSSRTLKQPMTLRVAEAAPGTSKAGAGAGAGDAAELRRALEKRAQTARRAEKWIDRAMEEVLEKAVFLKALSYMNHAQYLEVQHERHLNSHCAYPPCPNPPAAPYRARKRFVVSTAQRTITERDGNDDQAFCSRRCAARSAWVVQQLDTEAMWLRDGAKKGGVTLLEELEEKGEVVWGGRRGDVLTWVRTGAEQEGEGSAVADAGAGMGEETEKVAAGGEREAGAGTRNGTSAVAANAATPPASSTQPSATALSPAAPPVQPATSSSSGTGGVHTLLASLSIVERATPAAKPLPPKLNEPRLPVEPGAPIGILGGERVQGEQNVSRAGRPEPQPQPQPQPKPQEESFMPSSLSSQPSKPTSKATTKIPIPGLDAQSTSGMAAIAARHSPASRQTSSAAGRRAASSLLSTEHASLATSVINASKKIAVDEDSDESSDEEEWAKEMGWGEGPEVDALFAAAREAREMVEGDGAEGRGGGEEIGGTSSTSAQ